MDEEIKVKTAPQKPISVMVSTPMYGGMCTGAYVAGLLATQRKMQELGVNMAWAQLTNESLITRGRNDLVRIFLEKEMDYLMFIDADISFDGDAVAQLMSADRDIACGIYPKKEVNWGNVRKAVAGGHTDLEDFTGAFVFNMLGSNDAHTDEHGMIEVRHGGTGFMLIKRNVFLTLSPHVPIYRTSSTVNPETGEYDKPLTHEFFATSIDKDGTLLSEDYHFCELWREHGGAIHANPFIKLQHVGTYTYGGDLIKAGGKLK